MTSPPTIPAYLGRVVGPGDVAGGTCFQVWPGVLVTAWHVLAFLGAERAGAQVRVGRLTGGELVPARVHAVDELRDLAVLLCDTPFDTSVPGLVPSESVAAATELQIIGASAIWQGSAVRDGQVPCGLIEGGNPTREMSGAPVLRTSDELVLAVLIQPTSDGRRLSWAARTEDLEPLLKGVADVRLVGGRLAGAPLDLTLKVTSDRIRISGAGAEVTAEHSGESPGLDNAVNEVFRQRARAARLDLQANRDLVDPISVRPVGDLVAQSFMSQRVRGALAEVLNRAQRETAPVRLGVVAPGHERLPWESIPDPVTGLPLALHPLISVYRRVPAGRAEAKPGPLRIVIAIASPEQGGGPLLDYERELNAVLDVVRAARQDAAQVSVVRFATTAAIHAELDRVDAHVLHVTGHGTPGKLILEDEDGVAREVTATQFLQEAVPAGRMPPVVALAACYTDVAGQEEGISFAEQLAAAGACAVIATQTSVNDRYATKFFARVYAELASGSGADLIRVVADARRAVQQELTRSPLTVDVSLADRDEWSAVTVLAASPEVTFIDHGRREPTFSRPPGEAAGFGRPGGQFVGRRSEQRRLPTVLQSREGAGLVLYGIGGVGKTALAYELLSRLSDKDPGWQTVRLSGVLTVDGLLGAVADKLRPELLRRQEYEGPQHVAVQNLQRVGLPWRDRFALLYEDILTRIPLLLLLDDFEDNLTETAAGGWIVSDPSVREMLSAWARHSSRSQIIITSRYRFTLSDDVHDRLRWHHVGALSFAETRKLMWSLPAIERHAIDHGTTERIWHALGGHPRALEYLDAILRNGQSDFPEIKSRLFEAARQRYGTADAKKWMARTRTLDVALAEDAALAADEVLLTRHLDSLSTIPDALTLLAGISVFRRPVQAGPLSAQLAEATGIQPASLPPILERLANAGLVKVDTNETVLMHRWTATELQRHWRSRGEDALVEQAHRRAAALWQSMVDRLPATSATIAEWDEIRYHRFAFHALEGADAASETLCDLLDRSGAWDRESGLVTDTLRRLPTDSPRRWFWHHRLGMLAQARGDYPEAETRYRQALALAEQSGDRAGAGRSRRELGTLDLDRGNYPGADHWYREALSTLEQLGSSRDLADVHLDLGRLAQTRGNYREADRYYQRSLTLASKLDDALRLADARHHLGTLAHALANYADAKQLYERSLEVFENLGYQAKTARSYRQLGTLARDGGDLTSATDRYHRALDIFEDLGSRADVAESLHQLGILAQDRADFPEAGRRFRQALTMRKELGNPVAVAASYSRIGLLLASTGKPEERVEWHCRAFAVRRALGTFGEDTDVAELDRLDIRLGRDLFTSSALTVLTEDQLADLVLAMQDFRETIDNE